MFERVNARGFRDVSLADSDVIVFISSEGAPLHEIAKLRGVTKQAVHEQIHGLVKRGYLIIEVDPEDRRARIVRYTNKGRALVESLKSIKRELHNEVANTLGEKQTMALRKTLRLVENLRFAKHDD
jgi:DNA-binding MarR family transcriptional regulator